MGSKFWTVIGIANLLVIPWEVWIVARDGGMVVWPVIFALLGVALGVAAFSSCRSVLQIAVLSVASIVTSVVVHAMGTSPLAGVIATGVLGTVAAIMSFGWAWHYRQVRREKGEPDGTPLVRRNELTHVGGDDHTPTDQ